MRPRPTFSVELAGGVNHRTAIAPNPAESHPRSDSRDPTPSTFSPEPPQHAPGATAPDPPLLVAAFAAAPAVDDAEVRRRAGETEPRRADNERREVEAAPEEREEDPLVKGEQVRWRRGRPGSRDGLRYWSCGCRLDRLDSWAGELDRRGGNEGRERDGRQSCGELRSLVLCAHARLGRSVGDYGRRRGRSDLRGQADARVEVVHALEEVGQVRARARGSEPPADRKSVV